MITINQIETTLTTTDLDTLVEQAAAERNCELDSSVSYSESADWFLDEAPKAGNGEGAMVELSEILKAAEKRWFELEA